MKIYAVFDIEAGDRSREEVEEEINDILDDASLWQLFKEHSLVVNEAAVVPASDEEQSTHCQECGRDTRGNYVRCVTCDTILCDACDIRTPSNEEPKCREHRLDVSVEGGGTLFLLRPLTERAKQWMDEKIAEDAQWHGGALVVEHRYVDNILEGMREDGLVLE